MPAPKTISLKTVRADSIRTGDQFVNSGGRVAWTAIADAVHALDHDGEPVTRIDVQHHPDGGLDTRLFPRDMEWSAHLVARKDAVA